MVTVDVVEGFSHFNEADVLSYVEVGEEILKNETFEFLPKVGDEVILSNKKTYTVKVIKHFAKSDAKSEHTVIVVEEAE